MQVVRCFVIFFDSKTTHKLCDIAAFSLPMPFPGVYAAE